MNKKQMISFKILLGIDNGFYNPGDKLPSLRDIAQKEDVSLYTVINSFNELVSLGIIENRPKVGYFLLATNSEDIEAKLKEYKNSIPQRQKARCAYDEYIYEQYIAYGRSHHSDEYFQLSGEDVCEEYFGNVVYNTFQEVVKKAPAAKGWSFFEDSESKLASQIARWMQHYNCLFRKDHIITMNNSVEAIMYAVRACYAPGKILGVESPGHMSFAFCARFLTIEYLEIESDPDTGLCVDDLIAGINGGVKFFAILISSCNSVPTGALMPEENKRRLVEVCEKNKITIIEYDSFGRLSFSKHRCDPIKSLDHENTIYISDFSKIFGGGLPIGFLEGGKFTDSLLFLKNLSGVRSPTNEQLALSIHLVTEGIIGHIDKISKAMSAAVELFRMTMQETVPKSVSMSRNHSSPYLWIELPNGTDSQDFCSFASKLNVFVAPGQLFSSYLKTKRYFMVNCCTAKDSKRIEANAKALSSVITKYLRTASYIK